MLRDHPDRFVLNTELHARPFPIVAAPAQAAYVALKADGTGPDAMRAAERLHLIALLDRFGAAHPQPGATHYTGKLGRIHLKWEQHSEFVSYTAYCDGAGERAFSSAMFEMFPPDWLAEAPGMRITSALIQIEAMPTQKTMIKRLGQWFEPESLAVSHVLEEAAIIASDFRIDEAGHTRFASFVEGETGPARVGRVLQRLCEIETYKAMAMLGFVHGGGLSAELSAGDHDLTELINNMADDTRSGEETLTALLRLSARLEQRVAQSSYRFAATRAYATLVGQRIEIMREARYQGRQTFREFMSRRFDPAMRSVEATELRLIAMSDRALRAAELLRTRVDVERSEQNQRLLESMDKRADLQLRLQRTVEGLSVVAISYYAVSLAGLLVAPLGAAAGFSKPWVMAALVPPVLLTVWAVVRRIRAMAH